MVTISLKTNELLHITVCLAHIETTEPMTTIRIIEKLYRAVRARKDKAFIKLQLDTVKNKYRLSDLLTYKRTKKPGETIKK